MAPIDDIAKILSSAIIDALKDRQDELTAIAEAGGDKAGHGIWGDIGTITGIIGDVVTAVPIVGELLGLPLEPIKAIEGQAGAAGESFAFGYLLGYVGWNVVQPAILPAQHAVADALQTEIFDPQTAAQLESKGIIDNAYGRSEAAGGNLSGEHYDKLVDAAQDRPALAELIELLRRGEITQADYADALKHHGIPVEWIDRLGALSRSMLSPADLALANLRGFMDYGTARDYAAVLGIVEPDFQTLISNTGEPPGSEMLMEALRRGFIDEATFEHGIRQSRVRDEWIPTMRDLRLSPMSTADAVRAVVEDYISDDQGAAIAAQNGLIPEHWRPLVDSWGRPLSHEQMMTLYHRGEATLDEVRQAFRESDLKNKYIDQAIQLSRQLIPERTIVSMIDHGVVTNDEGVDLLLIHGYTREDADRLVALGVAQRTTSHKILSKSDVLTMYADALLNRAQATDHLSALGYQAADVSAMLDLADYKRKASTLKIVERGIQASLKAHHITQQQALTQLQDAGLDHAQAQVLVDEWLQERRVATRSLTEKQIVDAIGSKIFTADDGRVRLQALGFSAGDVDVIFKLNGIEPI
jgi:hypothetical protein